ncbi:hypothetical protein ACFOWB_19170 [Chenggangzhangella methanolivorans]
MEFGLTPWTAMAWSGVAPSSAAAPSTVASCATIAIVVEFVNE